MPASVSKKLATASALFPERHKTATSKSELISSISKVIKSYVNKNNNNIQNQILIQTQTQNII